MTPAEPASGPSRAGRSLDPLGKRALFEAPVQAAPDTLQAGRDLRGRAAFFSTGPRAAGTVVVECASCHTKTRVGLADVALRLLPFSLWLPLVRRDFNHHIHCPACERHTWCRIGWTE